MRCKIDSDDLSRSSGKILIHKEQFLETTYWQEGFGMTTRLSAPFKGLQNRGPENPSAGTERIKKLKIKYHG